MPADQKTPVVKVNSAQYILGYVVDVIYIAQMVLGAQIGKEEHLVKRIVAVNQYEPLRISLFYDASLDQ